MSYGLLTQRSDGTALIDPTLTGGRVYVGKFVTASGVTTIYAFPNIPGGSYLRILQVEAGSHYYTVGTNGSGQATLTVTQYGAHNGSATTLYVFTTLTTEPDFGISTLNDSGERTVSGLYSVPEFLGKLTFSSTPTSSYDAAEGSYWVYSHTTSTTLGAGRERLILWSMPENTGDCWFSGTTLLPSWATGAATVTAQYIRAPATPYSMPEAFVFALDGLSSSTDGYGLRVYSSTGAVTFDSGRDHMVIKGFETTVDYPGSSGVTWSYAGLTTLAGSNVPVFLIPSYGKEVWTSAGAYASNGKRYMGGMRRVGSTLYTRLVKTESMYEDAGFSSNDTFGVSTDLMQLVVDGALYGASNAALALTVSQISGTASCTYNSGGQTSCTSSSAWVANTLGGNANPVTYAWSIISNPGGFTISGSTSGTTCVVQRVNGTAPTSSSTAYSCVLRCTISQSGSTSAYVDRTVVHTHTDTFAPGGGEGNPGGY